MLFRSPKIFSNKVSQKEIVEKVLKLIENGEKIIFINGKCGTGKSAIALNLAKELGKTSIIVPNKSLQEQYKRDYEKEKYILKDCGARLKINVITGRKNHKCVFLKEDKKELPKKEINSKLYDIFEPKRKELRENLKADPSANNNFIPCKIEIKEKNFKKIKEYLRKNKTLKNKALDLKDIRRISVARACPYWSAV